MSAVLALVVFAFSFGVQAQVPPTIIRIDGQPSTAVYTDGREAEFRVLRGTHFQAPIPFKVSENSCRPGTEGVTFSSTFGMQIDRVAWFWTKHNDPAKVGQMLMQTADGMSNAFFSFAFITQAIKTKYPDLAPSMPANEFSFADLSWLPGMENGLTDFVIESWTAEQMVPNSQTGLNENRIVSGANGVRFKKKDGKTVFFDGAENIYAIEMLEFSAFAMLGDVVNWKLQANGQTCFISSKPNVGALNAAITAEFGNMDISAFQPYLWNSDSLIKVVLPLFTDGSLAYAK